MCTNYTNIRRKVTYTIEGQKKKMFNPAGKIKIEFMENLLLATVKRTDWERITVQQRE